ncbi:hypothetical protein I4U23_022399 [Adineta vaga]|nr:hypothetical protein I4U23_022399 [Adineta vaga]
MATTYWACQFKDCSAVAHTVTKTGDLTKQKNDHCHPPVPEKIEIRQLMNKVKTHVISETAAKHIAIPKPKSFGIDGIVGIGVLVLEYWYRRYCRYWSIGIDGIVGIGSIGIDIEVLT